MTSVIALSSFADQSTHRQRHGFCVRSVPFETSETRCGLEIDAVMNARASPSNPNGGPAPSGHPITEPAFGLLTGPLFRAFGGTASRPRLAWPHLTKGTD